MKLIGFKEVPGQEAFTVQIMINIARWFKDSFFHTKKVAARYFKEVKSTSNHNKTIHEYSLASKTQTHKSRENRAAILNKMGNMSIQDCTSVFYSKIMYNAVVSIMSGDGRGNMMSGQALFIDGEPNISAMTSEV